MSSQKITLVFFIGGPNSGKTTLMNGLKNLLGCFSMSFGIELKKFYLKTKNEEKIKLIEQGINITDEDVRLVLSDYLKSIENEIKDLEDSKVIIFDGFPRSVAQSELAFEILAQNSIYQIIFVELVNSLESLLERGANRVFCFDCNEVYNISNIKPAKENICDRCGKVLTKRKDDTEEFIIQRWNAYVSSQEKIRISILNNLQQVSERAFAKFLTLGPLRKEDKEDFREKEIVQIIQFFQNRAR